MNETFSQHSGTILREDRLGVFTRSPFLPVHFHWTTTARQWIGASVQRAGQQASGNWEREEVDPPNGEQLIEEEWIHWRLGWMLKRLNRWAGKQ